MNARVAGEPLPGLQAGSSGETAGETRTPARASASAATSRAAVSIAAMSRVTIRSPGEPSPSDGAGAGLVVYGMPSMGGKRKAAACH